MSSRNRNSTTNSVDIEKTDDLLKYLREQNLISNDERPRFEILKGGISNRTVLVERSNKEAWVLKQALEKLRVQVDWFSSPLRIHREALGLRWLQKIAPTGSITPLIFEDDANHILGMQAVPQPHQNWKSMLLAGQIEADHFRQFAELLAQIHQRSQRDESFAALFNDRSFFESLRLEPYYSYTASQVPLARNFLNQLIENTRKRCFMLVHGDYSPKNVLISNNRLILLDHEVIHFGDGAFDVGFSMTHFLSKAHHRASQKDQFREMALLYWNTYSSRLASKDLDHETYSIQHTLACLLARVCGRSKLEYLSNAQLNRQRDLVIQLIQTPPFSMNELIHRFTEQLTCQK